MLPHHPPAPQSPRRFGVGIDTSRYGHYAVFLREDLQPAAAELSLPESAAGYAPALPPRPLLRRPPAQQELPPRPVRRQEARPRRAPRRPPLPPDRPAPEGRATGAGTPPPPPGRRPAAGRRPPAHPPGQPV